MAENKKELLSNDIDLSAREVLLKNLKGDIKERNALELIAERFGFETVERKPYETLIFKVGTCNNKCITVCTIDLNGIACEDRYFENGKVVRTENVTIDKELSKLFFICDFLFYW